MHDLPGKNIVAYLAREPKPSLTAADAERDSSDAAVPNRCFKPCAAGWNGRPTPAAQHGRARAAIDSRLLFRGQKV